MHASHADRIKPTDKAIVVFLDELLNGDYQIPTFQRNVVWEKNNVKKLWDSICNFYPIGSILVWLTDTELHRHRTIGGREVEEDSNRSRYCYLLDGQQRTTALLTSLYGGEIEGRPDFKPELYVDLTVESNEDPDDETYRDRFLFWDEIDDHNGTQRRNVGRMKRYNRGLIVSLGDLQSDFGKIEEKLHDNGYPNYRDPIRRRLREIRKVLDNYRLSFIELRGIEVPEVCTIFERINQEGEPLDIFDIVVAKTYRPITSDAGHFYLRELCDRFKNSVDSDFCNVTNHSILQTLALLIRSEMPDAGIHNVTDTYLTRIQAEHIESIWPKAQEALLKSFDFFHNALHLPGPELIPMRYLLMTVAQYLFDNADPDYDFLKKYFWFYSFHYENRLRNTTHLRNHADELERARRGDAFEFEQFTIDRNALREVTYSSRGRLSRAILALLANQQPCDWEDPDRQVLNEVYYMLTDRPNLHHVFARGFIEANPGSNRLSVDSMMNIVYLRQIVNLQISCRSPQDYVDEYFTGSRAADVADDHLLPHDLLEWMRRQKLPKDALDQFIEARIDRFLDVLRQKIGSVEEIDTAHDPEHRPDPQDVI